MPGSGSPLRYLHEGIDVLAAHGPDLHDALARSRPAARAHVNLDGTLIETKRVVSDGLGVVVGRRGRIPRGWIVWVRLPTWS